MAVVVSKIGLNLVYQSVDKKTICDRPEFVEFPPKNKAAPSSYSIAEYLVYVIDEVQKLQKSSEGKANVELLVRRYRELMTKHSTARQIYEAQPNYSVYESEKDHVSFLELINKRKFIMPPRPWALGEAISADDEWNVVLGAAGGSLTSSTASIGAMPPPAQTPPMGGLTTVASAAAAAPNAATRGSLKSSAALFDRKSAGDHVPGSGLDNSTSMADPLTIHLTQRGPAQAVPPAISQPIAKPAPNPLLGNIPLTVFHYSCGEENYTIVYFKAKAEEAFLSDREAEARGLKPGRNVRDLARKDATIFLKEMLDQMLSTEDHIDYFGNQEPSYFVRMRRCDFENFRTVHPLKNKISIDERPHLPEITGDWEQINVVFSLRKMAKLLGSEREDILGSVVSDSHTIVRRGEGSTPYSAVWQLPRESEGKKDSEKTLAERLRAVVKAKQLIITRKSEFSLNGSFPVQSGPISYVFYQKFELQRTRLTELTVFSKAAAAVGIPADGPNPALPLVPNPALLIAFPPNPAPPPNPALV